VHLVPPARAHLHVIDEHRACQAIGVLPEPDELLRQCQLFALLGDPTRLTLLRCIHAAEPIAVTDLIVATGLNGTTVSQALRLLRARGAVLADRDGRVLRYRINDPAVLALLSATTTRPSAPQL